LNLADFSSISQQNFSSFACKSIEGNWQLEHPCKFLVNGSLQIGGNNLEDTSKFLALINWGVTYDGISVFF